MTASSANRPEAHGGRQYHIGLAPGEVAPRILLCGDPARADRVAAQFSSVEITARHREYVTHTGIYHDKRVSVMATGMGCDNTEIAVVELLRCVDNPVLVRIGTSGGLQPDAELGSLIVSTGAVRLESTSLGFVEPGFPAIAHHEVVMALASAAEELRIAHRVGLTATAAGFYGWQGRSSDRLHPRDPGLLDRLQLQGVLNLEMEASTLFTLAMLAGVRAGAVCAVLANRPKDQFLGSEEKRLAEDRTIEVGLRAFDYLDAHEGTAPRSAWRWPKP